MSGDTPIDEVFDFLVWRRSVDPRPQVWGAIGPMTACNMYVADNAELMQVTGPTGGDTLHFYLFAVRADGTGIVSSRTVTVTMKSKSGERGEA